MSNRSQANSNFSNPTYQNQLIMNQQKLLKEQEEKVYNDRRMISESAIVSKSPYFKSIKK